MANPLAVTLHASGEETASGSGTPVDISALRRCAKLTLTVTAISGTGPSLEVVIETGPSSSGPWRSLSGWSADAEQSVERVFGICDRYVRASWTLSGDDTPAATFGIAGTAEVLYATPADVGTLAMKPSAFEELDLHQKLGCCLAATDQVEDFLASSHVLPLVSWGTSLTQHTARIAAANMLRVRGAGGTEGPDLVVFDTEKMSLTALDRVANGRLKLTGVVDSTPEVFEGGSVVVSRPRRR